MSVVLPPPSPQYDAQNEAETRRALETAILLLSSATPPAASGVGGTGTVGKIPIWTGAAALGDSDIDAANLAYLDDLFTQEQADARYSLLGHTHDGRYSLLGHTHSASEITDFNDAGDARWLRLGETHFDGPIDIGDVSTLAAALLRVGGDINAGGQVAATDFVLEGTGGMPGPGASGSPVAIYNAGGDLLTPEVTKLRFTGAGLSVSNTGSDVTVMSLFDQAAADARYSLLGHTHLASQVTDLHASGNSWWMQVGGSGQSLVNLVLSGNANPYVQFSDGTYTAYWQMTSGAMSLYHNGSNRISVNGVGSLITFPGTRPITMDPGSGYIRQQADAGGWAMFYGFLGSSGTDRGGFGAFGGADALSYYYIGSFGAEQVRIYPNGTTQVGRLQTLTAVGNPNSFQLASSASPASAQILFGTDNTGYAFEIAKKVGVGGTETTLARFYDSGKFFVYGEIEATGNVTLANGSSLYGRRGDGSQVAFFRYDAGTSDMSTVMGGTIWRVRDTGSGVPMSLTWDGRLEAIGARFTGLPGSIGPGAGMELYYYAPGGYAGVQSYDRTNNVYKVLALQGSEVWLGYNGNAMGGGQATKAYGTLEVGGTIRSNSTYGWTVGNLAGTNRIYFNTDHFEFVNSGNGFTDVIAHDFILA